MEITAQQIAAYINGTVEGDANAVINNFAKIEEGVPGAISFLANPQYEHFLYETRSSVVLVNEDFKPAQPVSATLIRVKNAYEAVSKLLQLYESMKPKRTGISSLAFIAETAKVGKDVYIAPFVAIGDGAEVGDGAELHPHATIGPRAKVGKNTIMYSNSVVYHDCVVGDRCILHAGCVIGADGFGFAPTAQGYEKIPQIGIVTIEDDVEIGANTCIDRSTMGSTIVHKGVKLDNLVQIAHNVEVGSHTVMSAQVGVAGSCKVGEWCMLGGQVGVAGHITLGDRVYAGAQSGLSGGRKLKEGNCTVMGYPAIEHQNFARSAAAYKNLPNLVKQVNELQKEIDELKKICKDK
ncbi:MAG: UDP-3-O-(3-hydroxymyristoyl)glucosamine N-acyltransferase [Bacteroidaceae bacterium]|jgi:UDP-3-O-[3-hydroxymyristoyl] glucosamine N-acyltransferase|nr:UDP-3-O-(3-hydroxymyristoyl)glucosamine N-acyltransferase [Bacteroidaceae bacterium]